MKKKLTHSFIWKYDRPMKKLKDNWKIEKEQEEGNNKSKDWKTKQEHVFLLKGMCNISVVCYILFNLLNTQHSKIMLHSSKIVVLG